jgi:hypothetical protein
MCVYKCVCGLRQATTGSVHGSRNAVGAGCVWLVAIVYVAYDWRPLLRIHDRRHSSGCWL